ncbi:hypothetical protein NMY22_g20087 [Coprinellus aureogranulatus]|nr:hypothetical protein NMY22_g20087 [Coprinellus aureogranulatus]
MSSFPDMVAAASLSLSSITPESTPLSMSDTFTLSDTSSLRGLVGFASEFPQPPSLSPALRRMQSVPWLKDIHAASFDAEESYSWRRASQATERSTRDADTSFSRGANELPFPRPAMALEELIEKGSPLDRLREETKAGEISWTKRQTYKTRTTDDLLEWSKSNRSQDVNSSGLSGRRNRTESTPAVAAPIRQLPAKRPAGRRNTVSSITSHEPVQRLEKSRTIRKVASMQSDAKGKPLHESSSGQRSIPKIKSLRLFPSSATSSKREGKLQAVSGPSDEKTQATAKPRNWLFLRAPSTTKLAKDTTSHQRHQSRASRSSVDVTASGTGIRLSKKVSRSNRTPYPSGQQYHTQQGISIGRHSGTVQSGSRVHALQHKSRKQFRESAPQLPGLGLTNYESLVGSKSSLSLGLGLDNNGHGSPEGLEGPFTSSGTL